MKEVKAECQQCTASNSDRGNFKWSFEIEEGDQFDVFSDNRDDYRVGEFYYLILSQTKP